MNISLKYFFTLALFSICNQVLSQHLGCPIDGGQFKDLDNLKFSHHNPKDGAVILSATLDSVATVTDGKVLKITVHEDDKRILIQANDSTYLSYRSLAEVFVKEGDSLKAWQFIGRAPKNDKGLYEMSFTYMTKWGPVDPRKVLRCE